MSSDSLRLNSQVGFYVIPSTPGSEESITDINNNTINPNKYLNVPNQARSNRLEVIRETSEESSSDPSRRKRVRTRQTKSKKAMDNRYGLEEDSMDTVPHHHHGRTRRHHRRREEDRFMVAGRTSPSLEDTCRHPQSRICDNIKYNLQQLKLRSQRDTYLAIVDAAIVGPEPVKSYEVETILGISNDTFLKTRLRRKTAIEYEDYEYNRERVEEMRETTRQERSRKKHGAHSRPALREQFELFARFGDSQSTGDQITLSQTDKWLRQAGIIDNWNITTTDTAIYYRKISRGSKYLDYDSWRIFLDELAWRKRISVEYLIDKLELCGKPAYNNTTTPTLCDPFLQRGLRINDF